MKTIYEPGKHIPIVDEADVCVLGGSCTGVFAAVRAARLGAKVVIIEKQNCFGGVATLGLVNIWHSLYDAEFKKQIISGLTEEVVERLEKRSAVRKNSNSPSSAFNLNTEELKIELDQLITESKVKPYLHSFYAAPVVEGDRVKAVIIENKSGRQAIAAKVFIDATGDGDLCYHLGLEHFYAEAIQPPTSCAKLYYGEKLHGFGWQKAIAEKGEEFGLAEDWGWRTFVPGMPNTFMHAETHVFNVDCADASQLTYSEIEGRRQVRALMDLARKYGPEDVLALVSLPAAIGIRETRHIKAEYQLTERDLLSGTKFHDAVAYGSYRVDIHHADCKGITFKYLDGTQEVIRHGKKAVSRWREETADSPTYYQIPYRCLVPPKFENVLFCGRMIDADPGAFGAVRVMVNLNQLGEAAGVAAFLALDSALPVAEISTQKLREVMAKGGSIIFD
ncbi:MAG TPA: FAD-dependent oxidoreductase [Bacillota bacterium]|nr:FAD-dependent oxidoreductase [Bacillota bacterium]